MVVENDEGSLRSSLNCFAEVNHEHEELDSSAREKPVVPSLYYVARLHFSRANQSWRSW
jgi:hypothetical protein